MIDVPAPLCSSEARALDGAPAIDVRALRHRYAARGGGREAHEGTPALAGVDLRVGAREFVSLVGPSGCGKTSPRRAVAAISARRPCAAPRARAPRSR